MLPRHCRVTPNPRSHPMSDAKPDVKGIVCEALEKKSPEELAAYLEQACGGDR